MKNIKEIFNKIKQKNAATFVEASSARKSSKASPHTKTILIMLPILILLIAALIAIGITNAVNNVTEPETEQTFIEDSDGYYIWVRAVDHAGNKGPWSEAQRIWIDTKPPIVTCTEENSTITITEGTILTLGEYFNIEPNGKNENITITCTINDSVYETTENLTVANSPYTVTCTATKQGGNSAIATMTVVVKKAPPAVDSNGLAVSNTAIKPNENSNVQIVIPTGWAPAILESGTVNSLPTESGKVANIMPAEQWYDITVEQINQGIVIVNHAITYTDNVPDFEEYVWIPMAESKDFARVAWNGPYSTSDYFTGIHPIVDTATSYKFWEDKTTTEYINMVSSVTSNKGFYIGRYEASKKTSTIAQSKRGQTTWTSVTGTTAKTYSENNSIPNSHLIYGIEWDSILNWLIGRATIGGETSGSTKTLQLSDLQSSSITWGNYQNSSGGAATNAGSKRVTGYNEYWKANNIYDLAGNVREVTQENYGVNDWFAKRGGSSWFNGTKYPAVFRLGMTGDNEEAIQGFRISFFL